MWSGWIAAVLSFIGAGLGASISYLATTRVADTQEGQHRREGWGRRFTAALNAAAAPNPRQRALGLTLLGKLAKSSLASDEERRLTEDLLLEAARYDPGGADLRLIDAGAELDDTQLIAENGDNEQTEREGGPT